MTLLLYHPRVAQIDCNDCLKRRYDLKTGKPDFYHVGPYLPDGTRKKEFFWGQPTACQTDPENGCPKGKPHQGTLSPRNMKMVRLYLLGRATGFVGMRIDRLARHCVSIIDSIYRSWDRHKAQESTAEAIDRLLPLIKRG